MPVSAIEYGGGVDLPNGPDLTDPRRTDKRLNSWKAIGAFFERDERTVRRWEAERGLPVHRVPGAGRSSVFAYTSELAEWLKIADTDSPQSDSDDGPAPETEISRALVASEVGSPRMSPRRTGIILVLAIAFVAVIGAVLLGAYHRFLFSHAEAATPSRGGVKAPTSTEAQELYLQGQYHWDKRTPKDLNQAVDDFTQSIVKDPETRPATWAWRIVTTCFASTH